MIEPEQEFNQQYLPPEKKPLLNKQSFLKIIIFSLIIILLILFIFLFYVLSAQHSQPITTEPTPEPEIYYPHPTSSIQIQPSYLATDSAILKTKAEVESNISTANSLDLSESNLSFPILDFEIGFE